MGDLNTAKYDVTIELLQKLLASNSGREKGKFVFAKDKDGNVVIEDYRLSGFLESAARALFYKDPKTLARVRRNLFVSDTRVEPPKPPDGYLTRPVVAQAADTSRASIITSEYLAPGTRISFTLEVVPPDALSERELELLLKYGEKMGLGQWRKAGFGRFKVVRFQKVT